MIIPEIYQNIAVILDELHHDQCSGTFTADEVVVRHEVRFPTYSTFMEQRRQLVPGSHSLRGYLTGMLEAYSKLDKPPGRSIQWIQSEEYRFGS